ncbi:MAG: hypothetical protein N3B01_09470 [Verrucomicrobiae bacterium]|nr:hypothetical protein [Verrucomicrobiae bacterium]
MDATAEPAENGEAVARPEYIADCSEEPSGPAFRSESQRRIETPLGELDGKHRIVFLLMDVHDLWVNETADTLRLSEANAKVRLLRGCLQPRERLTRIFGDERRHVTGGHQR